MKAQENDVYILETEPDYRETERNLIIPSPHKDKETKPSTVKRLVFSRAKQLKKKLTRVEEEPLETLGIKKDFKGYSSSSDSSKTIKSDNMIEKLNIYDNITKENKEYIKDFLNIVNKQDSLLQINEKSEEFHVKKSDKQEKMTDSKDSKQSKDLQESFTKKSFDSESSSDSDIRIVPGREKTATVSRIIQSMDSRYKSSQKESKIESVSAFDEFILNKGINFRRKTFEIKDKSWLIRLGYTMKKILHSSCFTIILTCAIIIILFIEDLKELCIPKEYDFWVDLIVLLIYCFFLLEFTLFTIFMKSYRFSFFFFIDVLSISGLTPTIEIFWTDYHHHPEYVIQGAVHK